MFNHLFLFLALLAFVSASLHLGLLTVIAEELSLHLGHISSVQLVQQYLTQIEAHNENGLGLRAIIDVSPKRDARHRRTVR